MANTISDGTSTITPRLIKGYKSSRPARNVVHDVIGTELPSATLRKAGYRRGTLEALFDTFYEANLLEFMLSQDKVCTLTVPGESDLGMAFVATDEITLERAPDTDSMWLVTCGFQEI